MLLPMCKDVSGGITARGRELLVKIYLTSPFLIIYPALLAEEAEFKWQL